MSYFPTGILHPARREGESYQDYRDRRKTVNRAVEAYCKGRVVHVSSEIRHVAVDDPDVDELIRRRQVKPVGIAKIGTREVRVVLTKGVTYRRVKE